LSSQKTDILPPGDFHPPERCSLSVIPTLSDLSSVFSADWRESALNGILRDHEDSVDSKGEGKDVRQCDHRQGNCTDPHLATSDYVTREGN
jgi:hypothetical protein